MTFQICAAVACLLLSAFFSASEMALSSANRIRLENLAEDGKRAAALAVKILDRFDDALSAILIGNNFVNIALSSLASVIAITAFGESCTWLATVIVTVAVIIFGETMPKIIAKKNANRFSLAAALPVRVLSIILKPLTWVIVLLVKFITKPLKGEEEDNEDAAVEELQSIIETAEDEAVLDEDRSELLLSALDFDDVSASEVMTARVDIIAVDIRDGEDEIFRTVCDAAYSRIPVYDGSIDNIIGILYLNRYLKTLTENPHPDLHALLMPPCYIYKTTKLPVVLDQFRQAKQHMAIVTDEYGGVLGLITMEDVLEQIVGEIWDETDEIEDEVVERGSGVWELDGDMFIGDFRELMELSEDELETESLTVGGWTTEMFGTYPDAGQNFEFAHFRVTVLEADERRIEKILVEELPKAEEE